MASNDPPFAELQLDESIANFLMKNANANIRFALVALDTGIIQRETSIKLIEQLDAWKKLRDMLRLANPAIKDD